jgi:hypothetical protein
MRNSVTREGEGEGVEDVEAHVLCRVLRVVVSALEAACAHQDGEPRVPCKQCSLNVAVWVVADHVNGGGRRAAADGRQTRGSTCVDGEIWFAKWLNGQLAAGRVGEHRFETHEKGPICETRNAVRCSKMEIGSPTEDGDALLLAFVRFAWNTSRSDNIQKNLKY